MNFYCYTTGTLVQNNKMRPGYDCKCTGCRNYVKALEAARRSG